MNLDQINNKNWQLGLGYPGQVVLGGADIKQCIEIILSTRKGSDPLRPHFGCGLFDYIDQPINTAIPAMKKEILSAIAAYEPRVIVTKIVATAHGDEK